MALLNYTTGIDPSKTVGEIQACLARHGARGVMTGYGADGVPDSVSFVVPTEFGDRSFQLPARVGAVLATLEKQHRRGKVPRRCATRAQAARVAWRILKDWVEAQMAVVESGMVTVDEVMFAYMIDGRGHTAYEIFRDQQLALPAPTNGA